MNPGDLKDTLCKLFAKPERMISVFLMGGPGVGKTSIVSQAAREVRKQVLTIALPTCEAVDLRGLPYNDNGRTRWASPLPRGGQGVLLLDELSSAAPDVQVAAHHLVWPEEGSDMSLPAGWHIVLTGNRSTDKTLFRAASGPLRNRLTIIPVEASLEHWVKWAMEHNINPAIIGFLRWRPELLTSKEIPNDGAFTSPRAWVSASEVLSFSVHANVERELLLGTVGEGATTEFTAYLRLVRELPAIQAIMDKPDKAAVPTSPSLLYALTSSLAQYTREKKESAMPYVKRMPAEFALLYVRDIRDYFDITTDQDVREWISKHKSLFKDDKS